MTVISKIEHNKLLSLYCNKNKHKLRDNNFGTTFCIICGILSTKSSNIKLEESYLIKT